MKVLAIIAAAGEGTHWGNHLNMAKQMVPINASGQTLIGRTIEILKDSDVNDIYVATHNDKIIRAINKVGIIRPAKYQYLSDTILSTQNYWAERTVILLGDVYFSKDCLKEILNDTEQLKFFGTDLGSSVVRSGTKRGEMYALTFDISERKTLKQYLFLNSRLARYRDKGSLLLFCLKKAFSMDLSYITTLRRFHPPKPPWPLKNMGFEAAAFWQTPRLLITKPRTTWVLGKLLGVYVVAAGITPKGGPDYRWPQNSNGMLHHIDDITQDIDSKEDYYSLIEKLGCLQKN